MISKFVIFTAFVLFTKQCASEVTEDFGEQDFKLPREIEANPEKLFQNPIFLAFFNELSKQMKEQPVEKLEDIPKNKNYEYIPTFGESFAKENNQISPFKPFDREALIQKIKECFVKVIFPKIKEFGKMQTDKFWKNFLAPKPVYEPKPVVGDTPPITVYSKELL